MPASGDQPRWRNQQQHFSATFSCLHAIITSTNAPPLTFGYIALSRALRRSDYFLHFNWLFTYPPSVRILWRAEIAQSTAGYPTRRHGPDIRQDDSSDHIAARSPTRAIGAYTVRAIRNTRTATIRHGNYLSCRSRAPVRRPCSSLPPPRRAPQDP